MPRVEVAADDDDLVGEVGAGDLRDHVLLDDGVLRERRLEVEVDGHVLARLGEPDQPVGVLVEHGELRHGLGPDGPRRGASAGAGLAAGGHGGLRGADGPAAAGVRTA